jgi:hypothetical protein
MVTVWEKTNADSNESALNEIRVLVRYIFDLERMADLSSRIILTGSFSLPT